jgi:hypothetical protein
MVIKVKPMEEVCPIKVRMDTKTEIILTKDQTVKIS